MGLPELSRSKRLLFWSVMLAGTLGVGELLARAFLLPPALTERRDEYALIAPHAVRGFGLKPDAAVEYHRGGRSFAIQINHRGFRGGSFDEALRARVRLLAVGDSFTFGLGVDSTNTWPAQVESSLRAELGPSVRVVNAGVPAYSARQMRQVTDELMDELRPGVVLFGLNSETFWRVDGPYLYRGGELVSSAVSPHVTVGRRGLYYSRYTNRPWMSRIDLWLNQHFELGAQMVEAVHLAYGAFLPRKAVAPMQEATVPVDTMRVKQSLAPELAELERAWKIARAGGAEFVVLLINPQRPDGSFAEVQRVYNRVVSDFCRARGIAVVDPLPVLLRAAQGKPVFRSADDYHWTASADELAGGQLYLYLKNAGLSGREPTVSAAAKTRGAAPTLVAR